MRKLIPVEGYPNLVRDERTGIILDINKSKAEQYRRLRDKKMKEKSEVQALRSEVQELKTMLQKLLENGHNA